MNVLVSVRAYICLIKVAAVSIPTFQSGKTLCFNFPTSSSFVKEEAILFLSLPNTS